MGRRTVITAAHCLVETTVAQYNSSANFVTVQTGAQTRNLRDGPPFYPDVVSGCGQQLAVAKSIPHPDFDLGTLDNDIALLILAQDIDFRTNRLCFRLL